MCKKQIEQHFIDDVRDMVRDKGGKYIGIHWCSHDRRNKDKQLQIDYFEEWFIPSIGMVLIEVNEVGTCHIYKNISVTHNDIIELLK